jgi:hypothetical protein
LKGPANGITLPNVAEVWTDAALNVRRSGIDAARQAAVILASPEGLMIKQFCSVSSI